MAPCALTVVLKITMLSIRTMKKGKTMKNKKQESIRCIIFNDDSVVIGAMDHYGIAYMNRPVFLQKLKKNKFKVKKLVDGSVFLAEKN
jgi:hypothetical protein